MTKIIDNFPNYTISSNGIVTNIITNYTKKAWLCKNGYYYVDLQHKGYKRKFPLHRLIATHFIPNPDNKRTVNHIDGNKTNNAIENLEWCTDSENMQHAYDTNLNSQKYSLKVAPEQADELFLTRIMTGTTITALAKELNLGITQLSYRIKEASVRLNMEIEYAAELKRQKLLRQSKAN